MLGPEGVAEAVLAAIRDPFVARLAVIRAELDLTVPELADPVEWQDFEEDRSTWDDSRLPLVQVVLGSAANPRRVRIGVAADVWSFDYQARFYVLLHGVDWRVADRRRKRFVRAMRETLMRLAEVDVDDAPLQFLLPSFSETYSAPRVGMGGRGLLAEAQVQCTVRSVESIDRPLIGKVDEIRVFPVALRPAEPVPVVPPTPLPVPVVIP